VAISRISGDGKPRYIAAIRDISDRKHAERMKSEFVSTVSHELRTPLTSIGGSLGLLSAGAVGQLNDQAKRLVAIAHSNCERLIRLINDILDIEKIESGKMEFDLRRMQVTPLVQRTVAALRGFADQHEVTLTVTLPPWPQSIKGDPDRLEQLLTNLVSNAIKHSPKGGEVEIFSDHSGGMVRIEVRDRGPGVPADFRGRIFGKFAMADASDSRVKGGTGLGLSIAREIARRHGAEVGFDDREGGGTAFHVDLPLDSTEPATKATVDQPDLPRILHLDDDLDCLSVVASAFAGKAALLSAETINDAQRLLAGRIAVNVRIGPFDLEKSAILPVRAAPPLDQRQAVPGVRIVRRNRQRRAKLRFRFVQPIERQQRIAQLHPRIGIARASLHPRLQQSDRARRIARPPRLDRLRIGIGIVLRHRRGSDARQQQRQERTPDHQDALRSRARRASSSSGMNGFTR
jgi:hypothetical protein